METTHCCLTRRPLEFRTLHAEQGDEFYELHFNKLVTEIYGLANRTFTPDHQSKLPKKSPWRQEYSPSFYKYVEALANPDPHAGDWDRLLRDGEERGFLLQAMILKILDTHVLSSLLFGADPEHMKHLKSSDVSFAHAEGMFVVCRVALRFCINEHFQVLLAAKFVPKPIPCTSSSRNYQSLHVSG